MEKKTYITMQYHELEAIIAKTYGIKKFQMIAANDSEHTYEVKKEPLDKWDSDRLPKLIASECGEEWELNCIMTDLANKDILEEGEYLIEVSW